MNKLHLALCCFALLAMGCGPTERSTGDGPVMTVSQKRVMFDGELSESQRSVSIVPAPGWTRRESDIFLSVVHSNGNVLNISPAYGPFVSSHDVRENTMAWVTEGRKQGSDVWDYREFSAGQLPGAYAIHIAGKKYQEPQGDFVGEIAGKWRIGFSGAFHPGDTDLNEITKMLKTIRLEPEPGDDNRRDL